MKNLTNLINSVTELSEVDYLEQISNLYQKQAIRRFAQSQNRPKKVYEIKAMKFHKNSIKKF